MYASKSINRIIETVVGDCQPAKIFLISHYERKDKFAHPVIELQPHHSHINKLDILVLVEHSCDCDELAKFLEERTRLIGKVTVLVVSIWNFKLELAYSHPFASNLVAKDCLIYDSKTIGLDDIEPLDPEQHPYHGAKEFYAHFDNANEFLAAANLFKIRKRNPLAAFSLHQCAEQLYLAALQRATGFSTRTNDLTRLQDYSYWYNKEMKSVFQVQPDTNIHLCSSLQKAYENARYNPDYGVSDAKLEAFFIETTRLFELVKKIN